MKNKMMDNKYVIKLIASQTVNGDTDKLTFTAPAEFFTEDGIKVIKYKEFTEDSLTADDYLLTTIKVISDEKVSVTRTQKYTSKLFLEKHKIHQTQYRTQAGGVIFSVMCTDIDDRLTSEGGTLEVKYSLLHGSLLVSENSFKISVKEN